MQINLLTDLQEHSIIKYINRIMRGEKVFYMHPLFVIMPAESYKQLNEAASKVELHFDELVVDGTQYENKD